MLGQPMMSTYRYAANEEGDGEGHQEILLRTAMALPVSAVTVPWQCHGGPSAMGGKAVPWHYLPVPGQRPGSAMAVPGNAR